MSPSHQDRVNKSYDKLCERCLKNPNRYWDDEVDNPYICENCWWFLHYRNNPDWKVPEHMKKYLIDPITSKEASTASARSA